MTVRLNILCNQQHYFKLIFRCNETSQVNQYAILAKEIQYAVNDTEIFRLTGCLSKCDKYHYTASPRSDLKIYVSDRPSLGIQFMFSNGKNEIKEQVKSVTRNAEHFKNRKI